jgi:integrase
MIMRKAKLDHAFCLTARCKEGKKKTDYYDEAVTGFVLECRSIGGKTFHLRYDRDGRQKHIKLAACGDVPFAAVKKKAEKLRPEAVLGEDPAAKRAQARAVPLYAELAVQHVADAKLHQRSYATTEMYMRARIKPRWGKVPLSQAAVDVIAAMSRPKGATYLFPSPADPTKPLGSIKHAWQTAREAAGLSDVRVHDLRQSASSFMVNSGVDLFAVGKVLGHASYQSTQRYAHLANDTLLAAVEAGAAKQALPA